jgi:regulator of RNase E activity RraA
VFTRRTFYIYISGLVLPASPGVLPNESESYDVIEFTWFTKNKELYF